MKEHLLPRSTNTITFPPLRNTNKSSWKDLWQFVAAMVLTLVFYQVYIWQTILAFFTMDSFWFDTLDKLAYWYLESWHQGLLLRQKLGWLHAASRCSTLLYHHWHISFLVALSLPCSAKQLGMALTKSIFLQITYQILWSKFHLN